MKFTSLICRETSEFRNAKNDRTSVTHSRYKQNENIENVKAKHGVKNSSVYWMVYVKWINTEEKVYQTQSNESFMRLRGRVVAGGFKFNPFSLPSADFCLALWLWYNMSLPTNQADFFMRQILVSAWAERIDVPLSTICWYYLSLRNRGNGFLLLCIDCIFFKIWSLVMKFRLNYLLFKRCCRLIKCM